MQEDTLILDIEPGGDLRCVAPRTIEDRSTMFAAVVGISLLLGCDLVMARHWLPGVHLFVQAAEDLPVNAPIPHLGTEWQRLQPVAMAWLDGGGPPVLHLHSAYGHCSLASDRVPPHVENVAFTLDLRWPLPPALLEPGRMRAGPCFNEVKRRGQTGQTRS